MEMSPTGAAGLAEKIGSRPAPTPGALLSKFRPAHKADPLFPHYADQH